MKRFTLPLALLLIAFSCIPQMLRAQTNQAAPPGLISYQGYLTDANGIPLATNTPQNFNIIFNIYSVPSGGTSLWGESQVVTVNQGFFTVLLGVGNTIPSSSIFHTNDLTYLFATNNAQNRYVGITVAGLGVGEIVPRLRLLASPYALLASTALSVAGNNSVSATNLGPDIGLWNVSGANVYRSSGNVGIGTTNPLGNLQVNGIIQSRGVAGTEGYAAISPGTATQAGYFSWFRPAATPLRMGYMGWDPANISLNMENGANFYFANGNVGIGTGTPGVPLGFSSNLGDKIALWPATASNNVPSYGFGIQSGLLQIHTDSSGADVAFGYGTSASMTETMRIKGNGNLIVQGGISSPKFRVSNPIPYGSLNFGASTILPRSGTFTSGGGTLDISATASFYSSSAASTCYLTVQIDGNTIGYLQMYFNSANVHLTCPTAHFYYTPGAGSHTVTLAIYAPASFPTHYDLNDVSQVSVTELPF